ncbi:transcriptional regulator, partial [Xanthomonas oryzae pv. oryzae]
MKSQDILLLLKLVSLERQQSVPVGGEKAALGIPDDWRGWAMSAAQEDGGASGLA